MAIRMIVSDLDGTMLGPDFQIPAVNRTAVRRAAAAGVTVVLATGRMYCSALPYALALGLDTPIISYNGALVKATGGKVLSASSLAPDTVARALDFVLTRGWYVQLYQDDTLYYAKATPPALAYENAAGITGHAVGESGLRARNERVSKLLLVMPEPALVAGAVEELNAAFPGELTAMRSAPTYIEVIRPGVSKAAAMLTLAQEHGIAPEEIMALGDSGNDISMLQAAGLGVAMAIAGEDVKRAADKVEASVADAVNRYVLAGAAP